MGRQGRHFFALGPGAYALNKLYFATKPQYDEIDDRSQRANTIRYEMNIYVKIEQLISKCNYWICYQCYCQNKSSEEHIIVYLEDPTPTIF